MPTIALKAWHANHHTQGLACQPSHSRLGMPTITLKAWHANHHTQGLANHHTQGLACQPSHSRLGYRYQIFKSFLLYQYTKHIDDLKHTQQCRPHVLVFDNIYVIIHTNYNSHSRLGMPTITLKAWPTITLKAWHANHHTQGLACQPSHSRLGMPTITAQSSLYLSQGS
jgi:hypothetical protein